MEELVLSFIKKELYLSTNSKVDVESVKYVDSMITVLHSHRHKKNDVYIKSRDFSKIRKVLYSFSTTAKKIFLSDKYYAHIFANFYRMSGEKFILEKAKQKPTKYRNDLQIEFDNLYKLASKTLEEC